MENFDQLLLSWLNNIGLPEQLAAFIKSAFYILSIGLISFLGDIISKKLIIKYITKIIQRTKNTWDDILLKHKVFSRAAHFTPALIIYYAMPLAFPHINKGVTFIQSAIYIYITILTILIIHSFLKALNEIYQELPISKNRSIKGYIQLINILVSIVGVLLIYSFITGNPINGILTGLGAMAAVIMLVFKDTILGLVASIQLSANNMVKMGDWISMPSRKADGDIIEISLNTVKVQNFDKTITTIPTYALVSESFTNWRGMEESDGRRIKRAINIDMRSVKFCSPQLIDKFKKIQYLTSYIEEKNNELTAFNTANNIDNTVLVNGRRLTNLGTFRKYIELFLKNHPKIHNEMTFLVRQLHPSPNGIPIEIYVFSKDQAWANYESIQADIFDHILAIIPEFELEVFQTPSGADFAQAFKPTPLN